jgi:hypothetical protein
MQSLVKKASGVEENFDVEKIVSSLKRSGVADDLARATAQRVVKMMGKRVTSREVYEATIGELRREKPVLAARYSLKKAMMSMGPSGYPFEQYIGAVLSVYGYDTYVGQLVAGECVQHEIDVIADKGEERNLIECKYHNRSGTRSDVKVALASYARYLDIAQTDGRDYKVWVVTNTKVTSDAAAYGKCVGMKIVGWRYPNKGNLAQMVESRGLYPVTTLEEVKNETWQLMSEQGVVLVTQIVDMGLDKLRQRVSLDAEVAKKIYLEAVDLVKESNYRN